MKQILHESLLTALVLLTTFSITQAQTIPFGNFEDVTNATYPTANNVGNDFASYIKGPYTDPAGNYVIASPTTNPGGIWFSRQHPPEVYSLAYDKRYFTTPSTADFSEMDNAAVDGVRMLVLTDGAVLALKLSTPLIAGKCYTVKFHMNYMLNETPQYIYWQKVEFGIPTSLTNLTNLNDAFGTAISAPFESDFSAVTTFTQKSFQFTAPSAASYISLRIPLTTQYTDQLVLLDAVSIENGCAALPVKFINFSAQPEGKTAKLSWSTSMETNSKGFEIQRSSDARNWQILDFVNSKESESNSRKDYFWLDKTPLDGINYYRLKQVDRDGTVDFSRLVTATFDSETKLVVAPNPVTDRLKLANGVISSITGVKLTNATGRIVYQSDSFTSEGIDMSHLPVGVYILRLQKNNGKVEIQKIIKQ